MDTNPKHPNHAGSSKNRQVESFLLALCIGFSTLYFNISFAKDSEVIESSKSGTNHVVKISNFSFEPKHIRVKKGDTVTWKNIDYAPHNITETGVSSADTKFQSKKVSPDLNENETFSLLVSASMSYICGLHPSMKGSITVRN